jgi:soluble lytic murein transglycosylase-like protein
MRLTRLTPIFIAAALAVPATAAASVTHTVRHGETLTSVAAADGLSIGQLAAANGISPAAQLVAGAELLIPAQGAVATALAPAAVSSSAPAATPESPGGFVVRRGDTLTGIAARFGVSVSALAAANGMSVNDVLLAGRTLSISGAPVSELAPAGAPAGATSFGAAPTDETVSPSDVGEIAAGNGVPASFAEAIADQESGFNNAKVSATGATGVMQIEPGTWRDLSRLDGLALSPDSATDNIRGGVTILRSLLDATGGDQAQTAAAYFQGLQSVREHGQYGSTRQYVRDVLALEGRF